MKRNYEPNHIIFAIDRYLTNEGIQYLRDYLHLPPEIVPTTLKRQARAEPRPGGGERRGGERRERGGEGDRAAYRRAPGGDDKAGAAGPGSAPMEFVSALSYPASLKKSCTIPKSFS